MATIAFASSKGGCGKTTAAVLIACELAKQCNEKKLKVALIDADPNQHCVLWGKIEGCPDNLNLISSNEDSLLDDIENAEAEHAFTIIDLEGSANLAVAHAVCRSDIVIIPSQGSRNDEGEALKTIKLIRNQSKALRVHIPYSILITRASPLYMSRELKATIEDFKTSGVDVLSCQLIERTAFKSIFSFGGTLYDLDPKEVPGIDKAIDNIKVLTEEIKLKLYDSLKGDK